MSNKSNKYILFIGGNGDTIELIKYTKSIGYKTIVVDRMPTCPSKRVADVTINCSVRDENSIIEICKGLKIAAIYTAYGENSLIGAFNISQSLNLPFYANSTQLEVCTDKLKFKRKCIESGLKTVPEYSVEEAYDVINNGGGVIIKPVDSAGGKGISLCSNNRQIEAAIKKALEYSPSKQFIIEKYMDPRLKESLHFHIHYSFANGEYQLSLMGDGCPNKDSDKGSMSTAYIYPSLFTEQFLDKDDNKMKNMFKNMGIENGAMFIEGSRSDENFVYWECGYRLGASCTPAITRLISGADQCKILLDFAINGRVINNKLAEDPWLGGKKVCNLLLLSNPGTILGFEYVDKLLHSGDMAYFISNCYEGQIITPNDILTYNQVVGRAIIIADDYRDMLSKIQKIFSTLSLKSINGDNLLADSFNYDHFYRMYC